MDAKRMDEPHHCACLFKKRDELMTEPIILLSACGYHATAARREARLRDALIHAEAAMTIVEPRSDKAAYLAELQIVRQALKENADG